MRDVRPKLDFVTTARRMVLVLAIAGALTAGWLAVGRDEDRGSATPPARAFAPTSFWNAPLSPAAPVDPASPVYVNELVAQVRVRGAWINSHRFSTPLYAVSGRQRTVRVTIDKPSDMYTNDADGARLARQLSAVPMPKNARPAAGTDGHIVIWQPSRDRMWELWQAHWARGWHASWGARLDHVSQSDGVAPYPFGATASGLALAGGLIRVSELRAGEIDHALAVAIPSTARDRARPPANRSDGQDTRPTAIPEGMIFRLDPALDVASLHLHPVARAMALAAQRHGIVVRDRARSVVFYAEDPRSPRDPYRALYRGQPPGKVLAGFPWDRLQALAPPGG